MLKAETFDLVLCDLVMPGRSGHEVISVLNKIEKKPKIGLMTGWGEQLPLEGKDKLDVDFIIRKPFNITDLVEHINELFV